MRWKIQFLLVAVICILAAMHHAIGQYRIEIEWRPEPLVADQDVIMTILGTAWVANDWDSILFRRERSTLFATFYDYSREFLEVDPEVNFQIVHNWGRLDAGDYDLWVDIFWDDEFEEGEGYFNVYHNLSLLKKSFL